MVLCLAFILKKKPIVEYINYPQVSPALLQTIFKHAHR